MEEWHLFRERDETEIEAGRRAMSLPGWTLNQTLAWIATRKPEAVGRSDGEIGLSVWMAFEEVAGRAIDFPYPHSGDAWRHLAMALAQRKLVGFATQVQMTRTTGIVQHSLGMPFPPEGQAGFALQCNVFDGDRAVVAPTNRVMAASWTEFHDLTFSREDVVRLWPVAPVLDLKAEPVPAIDAAPLALADPSEARDDPAPPPHETGMAGRPEKSATLLRRELERRAEAGELLATLAAQVEALLAWLGDKYPQHPAPKPGTVENNLRALYKSLRSHEIKPTK